MTLANTGHPIVSGVGFSKNGDYACLYTLPGTDQSDRYGARLRQKFAIEEGY
jgi:hypothetical protein